MPTCPRRISLGLAALAVLLLMPAAAGFAQRPDPAGSIATENAALSARIADSVAVLERVLADIARLRERKKDLEASVHRVEASAQAHVPGGELAQTVIDQLRTLLKSAQFRAARDERRRLLAAASDAHLRTERALAELGDLDAAVARRLVAVQPPVPEAERPQVEAVVRERLAEQRAVLTQLEEQQQKLMKALREASDAARDLRVWSESKRAELTKLLFWMRARPGTQTVTELSPSLAWTVSPANWRAAGEVLWDEAARRPFGPAAALLVAAGLYAGRRRLLRRLIQLAPATWTRERYRIGHALGAVAISAALAMPGPIALGTAATLLGAAPDPEAFAHALGDALGVIARLLLALSAFAWLLDRRGVAVNHFGWDEASLAFAARALRRFTALFLPLMFIAALNGLDHAPYANRESLGRLSFGLAVIAFAGFIAYLLRRRGPLMQRLAAAAPRSRLIQFHAVWFSGLVALPLGIAALSAAGYFVAASHFFGRMVQSLFLVLGALTLYGVMALWVQLRHTALVPREGEEAARPEEGVAGEAGREIAEARLPRLDVAAIGEQARALLEVLITLLVLGGLWWVWKDSVPALSVVGDYKLWTYTETVDGKEITRPLTVGHLFLALLVGAVTALLVRNVGALLDIVLLQRLEMQADATYAIKVTTRYALAAAGTVAASRIIGIGWNDVQWLVAALGVGLGFGLQEIFSNFVAGLIMLAERPVRIGDVVTVGDVTGTVARIRARATAVVDFDNKEVLIPNKSFITDRVINWTLSSGTTRLLLKVGLAQGSDVAAAQQIMLEAVRRNPDVLAEPAPSVYFVGLGAASLDFEVGAFVGSFDKRLRVQHEINLGLQEALRASGIGILSGLTAPAGAASV